MEYDMENESLDFDDRRNLNNERIDYIEKRIVEVAKIDQGDLYNNSRRFPLPEARMAVWFVLHSAFKDCHFSLLGRIYKKDHTTIMHGVNRVKTGLENRMIAEEARALCIELGHGRIKLSREDVKVFMPEPQTFVPTFHPNEMIEQRKQNAKRLGVELNDYLGKKE